VESRHSADSQLSVHRSVSRTLNWVYFGFWGRETMSESVPVLLIGARAAVMASAVWASHVEAESKEVIFPRSQVADNGHDDAQLQQAATLDLSDTAKQQTAQPNRQVLVASHGDVVGSPRYASRQEVGGAVIVTFVATPPPQVNSAKSALPTGLPISGRLSSSYGYRVHPVLGGVRWHNGIDLAAPAGTPIQATSDGRVERAGWNGGFGLMVELDDGDGTETLYGHMSRLAVAKGETVEKGDVLGYVGSTGLSSGPHLHYEIRRNGRSIDPASTEDSKRQ